MAKAALVVIMEVDEEDFGTAASPLAEMLDAVREVLGTDRPNVTVYGAIKERAEEFQTICEEWGA